jgi:nucleoid DNA-binding protein
MTLTEIVEKVAEQLGAPPEVAWGFVDETIKAIIDNLEAGKDVKIRGLGRLYWATVQRRNVPIGGTAPSGVKLKFAPAARFRTRRTDMEKYGVVKDESKVKEAEKKDADGEDSVPCCPICLEELDSGGACPVHGTEPFELGGQGD